MLKVYFDEVLIDEDSYTALSNDYKLFTDNFKLGSVASNSFKLSVNKAMVENHPNEVKIEDDNTAFYLVVDSITEDKYVYNYTLTDKLLNFNFNYDASSIIEEKAELEETCYLSDIWHDMCEKAGVEYDEEYEFLNDIEVSWYDNTIQARTYLSFIAVLQGGYACILENGKQSFKPYKKASSETIDIDECSDFILGEKKTISRVVYDTGVIFWEFGDDTGNTLYLDTTNVFIINEETVENIYNLIVNFEFYIIDIPNAPVDSSIRAGDIITFTDGTNNYPTIAQYSRSYGGDWIGGYSLDITTDKQEETQVTGTNTKIKKIQSDINRIDSSLTITAEQTDDNSTQIVSLNQNYSEFKVEVEENYETINESESKKTELSSRIDGLNYKISQIGGSNLIEDSRATYNNEKWNKVLKSYIDTDTRQNTDSKYVIFLEDYESDNPKQIIQTQNGIHAVGFKYKKLIPLANTKIKINGYEIVLDSEEWKEENYSFEVLSNTIEIELISDTDDSCYVGDLVCRRNAIAGIWDTANGESIYGNTKIYDGVETEDHEKRTTLKPDGLRGYNKTTGELKFETTTKGAKGDRAEFNSSKIAGILRQKVSATQTWDTWVG